MRKLFWGLGAGAVCAAVGVAIAPHLDKLEYKATELQASLERAMAANAATPGGAPHIGGDSDEARTPTSGEKYLSLPDVSERLELTFSDVFNDRERSLGKAGLWRPDFAADRQAIDNHTLRGNKEQEVYVSPDFAGTGAKPLGLDPFSFTQRGLTITAAPTPPSDLSKLWNLPYTSGMLSSIDSLSQTYGYFEMRARLPAGKGVWPAFWLLPSDQSWPPELDIMEMLGDHPNRIYATPHSFAGGKHTFSSIPVDMADTSAGFHRYGALWTPTTIRWFVDRRLVAQAATPKDMNKPMYMIANLAIGGIWPGNPDASTPMPANLVIDYIRCWKIVSPAVNQGSRSN